MKTIESISLYDKKQSILLNRFKRMKNNIPSKKKGVVRLPLMLTISAKALGQTSLVKFQTIHGYTLLEDEVFIYVTANKKQDIFEVAKEIYANNNLSKYQEPTEELTLIDGQKTFFWLPLNKLVKNYPALINTDRAFPW